METLIFRRLRRECHEQRLLSGSAFLDYEGCSCSFDAFWFYASDVEIFDVMQKVVVLSGAGISAESGIPTFRGEGGLWREFDAKVSICLLHE